MIKKCKFCGKSREMKGKRIYCDDKCKKSYENSLRGKRVPGEHGFDQIVLPLLSAPDCLRGTAADYWGRVAPILIKRGHLNAISEDVFLELCDLVSRLQTINTAINQTNRSLLQIEEGVGDESADAKNKRMALACKESALSDIKRKYSRLLLDYCKQFYLTPLSNRGNFGISDGDEKDPLDEFIKGNK